MFRLVVKKTTEMFNFVLFYPTHALVKTCRFFSTGRKNTTLYSLIYIKIVLTRFVLFFFIMTCIDFLSPSDKFASIHYVGRTFDLKLICLIAANGSMNLKLLMRLRLNFSSVYEIRHFDNRTVTL